MFWNILSGFDYLCKIPGRKIKKLVNLAVSARKHEKPLTKSASGGIMSKMRF